MTDLEQILKALENIDKRLKALEERDYAKELFEEPFEQPGFSLGTWENGVAEGSTTVLHCVQMPGGYWKPTFEEKISEATASTPRDKQANQCSP